MSSAAPDARRDKKGRCATQGGDSAALQWKRCEGVPRNGQGQGPRPFTDLFEEEIMKTTHTTRILGATIAVLSLATAGAVFAHPGMGMGQGMGPGMHGGMYGPMHGGMYGGMQGTEAAAARLAELKAELKITAEQESAWQAYVAVQQQQAAARDAIRSQMQGQMPDRNATPAERSAHFEAMAKFRAEHVAARSAAQKDLYAVLTPEQKQLADQRLNTMGWHRMAGHGPAR
jgi:protein CpxP